MASRSWFRPKPALRTELLFYLSFLAAAALLVGVATTLVATAIAPARTFPVVVLLVALEVGVFLVYGRHLVNRLVLRPLDRVVAAADAVAEGDLEARAPDAETRDFATLAERLNRMTDHLLDAQSQLVRSEKLASVGRLAAGIAHEIGNPLGAIGTYVEVLRRRGGEDPEVLAGLGRELDRIDRIVRSLLDYARPLDEALQAVDLAAVVASAFELLRSQGALKSVHPTLDLAPNLPPILGRAHQLEQTLVNLVLNAVDAAQAVPGIVVVGARRWTYEPGHAPPPPKRESDTGPFSFPRTPERRPSRVEFSSGQPGALVFVADSGPGVPPEDRAKIFEPFFTTKAPGTGTGLGLAIVARAVHEMGGVVWVDTAREGGAAFKVFFPAVE
ncbi:MAG: sensor histidine kinase [Gemmatimonadales bacterium]